MAFIRNLPGTDMQFGQECRVAETVSLIGAVKLDDGANVWYGAVLRGDCGAITIGRNTAVEDLCVLHGGVTVGANCVIGHSVLLHSCVLGDGILVGMGATVLSGAVIGSGSIIAAGAVVTENMIVPPGSMVMGVPGKVKRLVTRREQEEIPEYAKEYLIFAAEQLPLI